MDLLHFLNINISLLLVAPWRLLQSTFVIGYLGPNQLLPLASIIAALVGVVMMFWGLITKTIRRTVRKITRRGEPVVDVVLDEAVSAPEDETTEPPAKA